VTERDIPKTALVTVAHVGRSGHLSGKKVPPEPQTVFKSMLQRHFTKSPSLNRTALILSIGGPDEFAHSQDAPNPRPCEQIALQAFAHKVRDIALARAGQFGVSLCFFPIALCLLCPAFHFNSPQLSPLNANSDMGRPDERDGAKARLDWARRAAAEHRQAPPLRPWARPTRARPRAIVAGWIGAICAPRRLIKRLRSAGLVFEALTLRFR
jgi:hypothetical protein